MDKSTSHSSSPLSSSTFKHSSSSDPLTLPGPKPVSPGPKPVSPGPKPVSPGYDALVFFTCLKITVAVTLAVGLDLVTPTTPVLKGYFILSAIVFVLDAFPKHMMLFYMVILIALTKILVAPSCLVARSDKMFDECKADLYPHWEFFVEKLGACFFE